MLDLSRLDGFIEILDRATRGRPAIQLDWESGAVAPKVNEKLRKYGLVDTFDPKNPINADDGLASDFFRAASELAVECGRICLDTGMVIKVTHEELKDATRNSPSTIAVGASEDRRMLKARRPEDKRAPKLCAPLAITVSEEVWVPLMQGVAAIEEVDILQGARLKTFKGHQIRSGTPYEVIAGRVNALMQMEALRRARRKGMASTAVISSVTLLGQAGGYATPGGFDPKKDIAMVVSPAPLKTTFDSLNKVAHAVCCDGTILAGSSQAFGDKADPPENAAILAIASALLEVAIHQSAIASSGLVDVVYNGSCGRGAVWAGSVAFQGLSQGTVLVTNSIVNQVAGPCTHQLLLESAVGVMSLCVSGTSMVIAPRSAGGKFTDYLTPLEVKFCGRVLKAAAGMSRSDANEIAKKLVPKYEGSLTQAPRGKSFQECYDLKKMRPSAEWSRICEEVSREVSDLGLPVGE
jgi:methylamine---corrinoid protein Co-methyltransferase